MKNIIYMVFVFMVSLLALSANAQQQPLYTENLKQFESNGLNQRTQKIIGCWLMITDVLIKNTMKQGRQTDSETTSLSSFQVEHLKLLKECLKVIPRNIAISKIKSLVNPEQQSQNTIQQLIPKSHKYLQKPQKENKIILSQFDSYLFTIIKKYQKQLNKSSQKGTIKSQIEEKLKKKQDNLMIFGSIPANNITKMVIACTFGVLCLGFCTCCRYQQRAHQINQKKLMKNLQNKQQQKRNKEKLTNQKKNIINKSQQFEKSINQQFSNKNKKKKNI